MSFRPIIEVGINAKDGEMDFRIHLTAIYDISSSQMSELASMMMLAFHSASCSKASHDNEKASAQTGTTGAAGGTG